MQHLVHADQSYSSSHLFLLFYLVPIIILSSASSHGACTQLERDSLLSFVSNLSSSCNSSLLGSWRGTDCCTWEGISCDGNKSVTHLWLPLKGLRGQISPALANLTHLSHLNLSHNWLTGTLYPALLWADHLVVLDVSFNHLSGGLPSPPPSSGNHPLQVLNVSSNRFTDTFPSSGWEVVHNLVAINASNNSFTGLIPSALCADLPLLSILDLSRNQFGGSIRPGLGNCSNLVIFQASFNNLSGLLPDDLFDAISLQQLSLPSNQFSGMLDGERITNLSNLTTLDLGGNNLTGQLPASICKLANLEQMFLYGNKLNGSLPSALSNCSKLKTLNLRGNCFTGELSAVNFSRLSNLIMLDLGNNDFIGGIPNSIYLSKSLTALRLAGNKLQGQIAPEMINLQSLSFLSLSCNKLVNISGTFEILKSCRNLTAIILAENFNGEAIPDANWFDGFRNLQVLSLAGCQLTGQVPPWLANLEKLEVLDLSNNRLTGLVPNWLGSLHHLFYLDVSNNLFSGEFPLGITGLPALTSEQAAAQVDMGYLELPVFVKLTNASGLQYNYISALPPAIFFGNNSLEGEIPPEIGLLRRLLVLDLSHNDFSGAIPVQLSNLTNLEKLDLSRNHLSGMIPSGLSSLHFLASFSVAYNDLEGPIPSGVQFDTFPTSSFEGNPQLCGSVIQKPCTNSSGQPHSPSRRRPNKRLIVAVALGVCSIGVFALTLLACCRKRHRGPGSNTNDMTDIDGTSCSSVSRLPCAAIKDSILVMLSPSNCETEDLTFSDILKATNNFDQENIIGCGGFGLVYKATLANGTKLAIKRLSGDMCLIDREFKAEVEALSTAQHDNLVSLRGYCICGNFRLLIYSYMENGSLDYWLHERDDGGSVLEWPARLKIAQGASCGLAYIHQICQPRIVHRDIKSSNILLDEEFKAHVADFGLSRLILPCNTHVTTELVGTLGYIPPEYGQAWVATLRGDVYSFGVVLLELLTGRRPVEILPNMSIDLVAWVQQMRCQGKQDEAFDPHLRGKKFEEQMLQVLDVACMCVNKNPFKRPTINEVVSWLENIGSDLCEGR
ncbi:tyrosine-sulfated glycopeptide receptor 1 [Cocos nucifera]|nr:tyrosine-sulfated glycopeptide receptor 1 [Cocos nucifera]